MLTQIDTFFRVLIGNLSMMERSEIMRRVKGRDTTPELTVRRILHAHGFRYRLHRMDLPGRPDIVFPSPRKVIFVHGCFWHGHDCARGARAPKTNTAYWTEKVSKNRARDKAAIEALICKNWRVLVVWECEISDIATLTHVLTKFLSEKSSVHTRRLGGSKNSK